MEWRLKKRFGFSIASHRNQPDVGAGLRVDSHIREVTRPSRDQLCGKLCSGRAKQPLILAGPRQSVSSTGSAARPAPLQTRSGWRPATTPASTHRSRRIVALVEVPRDGSRSQIPGV